MVVCKSVLELWNGNPSICENIPGKYVRRTHFSCKQGSDILLHSNSLLALTSAIFNLMALGKREREEQKGNKLKVNTGSGVKVHEFQVCGFREFREHEEEAEAKSG